MAKRTVKGSQSVYRAISVLRGVARQNRTGITATELSERIDLTPATAHRLLQVLVSENILTLDPYSKKYHLGLDLYSLGVAAHDFAVRDRVFVHLENLTKLSGETVFLFVRSGADSICLARLDGESVIADLTLVEGSRQPLGVGAGGLALLAAQSTRFIDRVLTSNANLYGEFYDAPLDEIRLWIADAKARGFSFDDRHQHYGVRAVATAIGPARAPPVAAVSIAMDSTRMSPARRTEIEALLTAEFANLDWSLLEADDPF